MSGVLTIPNGWRAWQSELGYGFSFDGPDVTADVDRTKNPETGLIEWRLVAWADGERRVDAEEQFFGQDLHSAFAAAAEVGR